MGLLRLNDNLFFFRKCFVDMGLLKLNDNFFIFRKASKCLCWEREIGVRRDFTFQQRVIADKSSFNDASVREEGTFCFWSMRRIRGGEKTSVGWSLPTQWNRNKQTWKYVRSAAEKSVKQNFNCRTFVFRTSTPTVGRSDQWQQT